MNAGMDTSVVLRLLVGEPAQQARIALEWLQKAKASGIKPVISDLVITEVYFALQYHFGVSKAEALHHITLLLQSGDVAVDGIAARVLANPGLATAKPGFVDRLIHEQYLQNGATSMVTFEKASKALKNAELLA